MDAVAALQRGVGSDHGFFSVRRRDELFATSLSLGKHSRRHAKGRVCACFSCSEHLSGLFTSQSRDEVWVSSPSALNLHVPVFSLVRPETSCVMKSGSVLIHSHFVWQTMFESGDFARQMTVITVVCLP